MKLDSFNGQGFNFFEGYSIWITMIESLYNAPETKDFQERNFEEVNFSTDKDRRFFTVVKILAENGPCTATEIGKYSTNQNQTEQSLDKKTTSYFQLLTGKKGKNISLLDRGVVISKKSPSNDGGVKSDYTVYDKAKGKKKFVLSYFGIFYAIRLFFGSNAYEDVYPPLGSNHNLSEQENTKTIIDLLAENYPWALPLIFGKWEDLKRNSHINAYYLAEFAKNRYPMSEIPLDMFDEFAEGEVAIHNSTEPFTDNTFDDEITARFYFEQKQLFQLGFENDVWNLIEDKEIKRFLKKVIVKYNNYIQYQKMYLSMYRRQFSKRK